MRVGRAVCAPALSNLMKLAANSSRASRKTTSRMAHTVPLSRTIEEFFVGAALRGRPFWKRSAYKKEGVATEGHPYKTLPQVSVGVLQRHERDPSHRPNNSADVSDHGE